MKPAALLLLCGLAACVDVADPCVDRAYDDPQVKSLTAKMTSGGIELQQDLLPVRKEAVRIATLRCRQASGLAPPGGVEPVRRPLALPES